MDILAGGKGSFTYLLRQKCDEHGAAMPITKWFHVVLYCIGDSKVQDADVKVVEKLLDCGFRIIAVFTHSDQFSPANNNKRVDALLNSLGSEYSNDLSTNSVCAVEEERWDGSISKTFGRDELVSK